MSFAFDAGAAEAYVRGTMSGTERIEFEARLSQDAALRREVDAVRARLRAGARVSPAFSSRRRRAASAEARADRAAFARFPALLIAGAVGFAVAAFAYATCIWPAGHDDARGADDAAMEHASPVETPRPEEARDAEMTAIPKADDAASPVENDEHLDVVVDDVVNPNATSNDRYGVAEGAGDADDNLMSMSSGGKGLEGAIGLGSGSSAGGGARRGNPNGGSRLARRNAYRAGLSEAAVGARPPAAPNGEDYELPPENDFVKPDGRRALSTFALDVDTGSYANVRRFIDGGSLPPADAVRVEELINAFKYADAAPDGERPLAVRVAVDDCPWAPRHKLARITVKAREVAWEKRPRTNLVFLLDVSGSMAEPNKLPLVVRAMKLLSDRLGENDTVSIVTYASGVGTALQPTDGAKRTEIRAALDALRAEGSTNGEGGIRLAYGIAKERFVAGGVNRVILCTDGDFNVGVTDRGQLLDLIADEAKSGVMLTVLGFGYGNLKDATLEQLADKGNGNYGYVDDDREARKLFVQSLTGTLFIVAKDAKIQVEFNPAQVAAYRLLGYENRLMAAKDFRNDKKDAGELGAGHVVTALYEIVPTGIDDDDAAAAERPLKYQETVALAAARADVAAPAAKAKDGGELRTVALRWKKPEADVAEEFEVAVRPDMKPSGEAAEDFRFASAVAMFGMQLRASPHRGATSWPLIEEAARTSSAGREEREEFLALVRKAMQLGR